MLEVGDKVRIKILGKDWDDKVKRGFDGLEGKIIADDGIIYPYEVMHQPIDDLEGRPILSSVWMEEELEKIIP